MRGRTFQRLTSFLGRAKSKPPEPKPERTHEPHRRIRVQRRRYTKPSVEKATARRRMRSRLAKRSRRRNRL